MAPIATDTVVYLTYQSSGTPKAGKMDKVKVSPAEVNRETEMPITFKDSNGGKVRIVFHSLDGKAINRVVQDSDPCTLTESGKYEFWCYFTHPGSPNEDPNPSGGVLDVIPPRINNT